MAPPFLSLPYLEPDRLGTICSLCLISTFTVIRRTVHVERGSSVGRMPVSQSREPGFEPRCYRFEVFSFTSRRLSRLSCINEYLAIDSGGNVSE